MGTPQGRAGALVFPLRVELGVGGEAVKAIGWRWHLAGDL